MSPAITEPDIVFKARDFRGSRYRCLLASSLPGSTFAEWLTSLVQPFATVSPLDRHMPEEFSRPDEAKLGSENADRFLDRARSEQAVDWWLAAPARANIPNWDLVSTCKVGGRDGLILVEAKAHRSELKENDRCGSKNKRNQQRISAAIKEANDALGDGWRLSTDRCYQLSNRFAWAWKIASLGKPIVLVYLGFLGALEMNQPFSSREDWESCVLKHANHCVPALAWERETNVKGTRSFLLFAQRI